MQDIDAREVTKVLSLAYTFLAEKEGYSEEQLADLMEARGSETAVREQRREYRFFVAEKEGKIRGVMALKENEITKLYVDPKFHRQEIGTMLFEVAQRAIARSGYHNVLVGTTGYGVPFYLAMGMDVAEMKTASSGPLKGWEITVLRKPLNLEDTTKKLKKDFPFPPQ
jgi:N-acetylglutamate synthase-like GNAT family acetyltransferase